MYVLEFHGDTLSQNWVWSRHRDAVFSRYGDKTIVLGVGKCVCVCVCGGCIVRARIVGNHTKMRKSV